MTGAASAEMTLIAESVANANARVRFYRVAYGAASNDQSMGRNEIISILDDITRGSRLQVVWNAAEPVSRTETKLAFLMIQCFETAMPYGGEVVVSLSDGIWRIHGVAAKFKIIPELWDLLSSDSSDVDLSPAQVQFALAQEMLTLTGRTLSLQIRDQDVLVSY